MSSNRPKSAGHVTRFFCDSVSREQKRQVEVENQYATCERCLAARYFFGYSDFYAKLLRSSSVEDVLSIYAIQDEEDREIFLGWLNILLSLKENPKLEQAVKICKHKKIQDFAEFFKEDKTFQNLVVSRDVVGFIEDFGRDTLIEEERKKTTEEKSTIGKRILNQIKEKQDGWAVATYKSFCLFTYAIQKIELLHKEYKLSGCVFLDDVQTLLDCFNKILVSQYYDEAKCLMALDLFICFWEKNRFSNDEQENRYSHSIRYYHSLIERVIVFVFDLLSELDVPLNPSKYSYPVSLMENNVLSVESILRALDGISDRFKFCMLKGKIGKKNTDEKHDDKVYELIKKCRDQIFEIKKGCEKYFVWQMYAPKQGWYAELIIESYFCLIELYFYLVGFDSEKIGIKRFDLMVLDALSDSLDDLMPQSVESSTAATLICEVNLQKICAV